MEALRAELEKVRAEKRQLEELLEADLEISSVLQLGQLTERILETSCRALDAETASIFLCDPETGGLTMSIALDPAGQALRHRLLEAGKGIAGRVAATRRPAIVNDVTRDPDFCPDFDRISGYRTRSILAVPLVRGDRLIGVVEIVNKRGGQGFTPGDLDRLQTLGRFVAVAVVNAQRYEEARSLDTLEEVSRFKSEMMRLLAHELLTPLTSIIGYLGLLRARDHEAEVQEMLEEVHGEARRLARMVDVFLNVSAAEEGRLELKPEPVAIAEMVERVERTFQPLLEKHTLEIDLEEGLPPVMADPERTCQVLENLVSNALKYSPDGGPVIIQAWHEPGQVRIAVSDRGIGLSPEDAGRIFQHFYRAHNRETRHQKGFGLGLTLARLLVEAQGGEIRVDTALGEGSTFHFTLPVAPR